MNSLVNGVPTDVLTVYDRGLAYGDGLFETVRVVGGKPTLQKWHLRRVLTGARRLRFDLDVVVLEREIDRFLAFQRESTGILKVIITRQPLGRGYRPVGCEVNVILQFDTLPVYPDSYSREGVALFACQTPLGDTVLAGIKHLSRLENVLARGEWEEAYPEGLMLGYDGRVVEGTMSNLFVICGRTLRTPSLERAGVEGVCREYILHHAPGWGFRVEVADIFPDELDLAGEVFVCNSVFGVWPVRSYRDSVWSVGEHTRTVTRCIEEQLNG